MRTFILGLTRTWLGLIGTVLTTVSAILFVILFAISLTREHGAGPDFGIVAFIVLPGIFVAGLLLIPLGFLWEKRRERLAAERGEAPPALPVLDFANPKTRQNFVLFLGLTLINIGILAVATYKGVVFMDSTTFCGKTCHSVMQPEYTTYSRSPHARLNCVSCHIGPAADWFVKSKLSGTWQIISVKDQAP